MCWQPPFLCWQLFSSRMRRKKVSQRQVFSLPYHHHRICGNHLMGLTERKKKTIGTRSEVESVDNGWVIWRWTTNPPKYEVVFSLIKIVVNRDDLMFKCHFFFMAKSSPQNWCEYHLRRTLLSRAVTFFTHQHSDGHRHTAVFWGDIRTWNLHLCWDTQKAKTSWRLWLTIRL